MAHYEDLTIDQGSDVTIQLELFNPDGSRKLLINWDSDAHGFGAEQEVGDEEGAEGVVSNLAWI